MLEGKTHLILVMIFSLQFVYHARVKQKCVFPVLKEIQMYIS